MRSAGEPEREPPNPRAGHKPRAGDVAGMYPVPAVPFSQPIDLASL